MSTPHDLDALKRAVLEKQLKARLRQRPAQNAADEWARADRRQPLPLSFSQQSLWFLAQLDPSASVAYNMPTALRLSGTLDTAALLRALNQLVARHESLRTRFLEQDGTPCQHINDAAIGFALEQHDLRALDPDAQAKQSNALCTHAVQTPFDLCQGPLVRGLLMREADQCHTLVIVQHHIITDGWSAGLFVEEIAALYQAECAGQTAALPAPGVQYADYAAWQRSEAQAKTFAADRDFWQTQLEGAPALLELPTDHVRPPVQRHIGDHITLTVPETVVAGLRALGQRHGCSLFMTLLTGWSIVLSRYSQQDDLVIGTPVANRPHEALERTLGFFVNTLPLRITLAHDLTVAEALAQVRARTLDAFAHQALPFERVVDAVCPERNLSYNPIFQVMMALNNTPSRTLALPGLDIAVLPPPVQSAHFDLMLAFEEQSHGLSAMLEYASDLFDRATVDRIGESLLEVLEAMTKEDTQSVHRLPLMSAPSRQHVLETFNDTWRNIPEHALLHALFEQQVTAHPDAVALHFDDQTMDYVTLHRRANRLAHRLIALGVGPDQRVALCLERSADMVVAMLATLKAGGACLPLPPIYPAPRLHYMLDDAQPTVLITHSAHADLLDTTTPCLMIDRLDLSEGPDHTPTVPDLTSQHLAYVIYTSGSTGNPKGVMLDHRNFVRLIVDNGTFDIVPEDCVAHGCNVAFDVAVWEIFTALLNGASLRIIPHHEMLDAQALCTTLVHHRVTVLWLTAGMFHLYIDALMPAFEKLRYLLVGGDIIEPRKMAQLQSSGHAPTHVHCGYSPTETTVFVTTYAVPKTFSFPHAMPIGRPMHNTRLYILDEHQQPVPIGVRGEIHIAGITVARGYLNRPDLTAERFLPDPFVDDPEARMYKSGDIGRWLSDGTIDFIGRNDFQIKLRGFRIELGEIEACLLTHPDIREAAVVAREDVPGDKRLVAYLLCEGDAAPSPAALREHVSETLADYMVPSAFVVCDHFPLNANGKLDRKALPAPDTTAVAVQGYAAPEGDTETALAALWATLLGLSRVGRHDNFFELGGHSLIAVKLLGRMRQQGWQVSLTTLFTHPTLSRLAQAAETQKTAPSVFDANPVPLKPSGELPPLYLVHEPSGDPLVYTSLAALMSPSLPVYALQALGVHALEHPPETLEALARCHVAAIRRHQPQGPYRLAGWSMGGVIAYEMAMQLRAQGATVDFVGLLDAYAPDFIARHGLLHEYGETATLIEMLCLFLSVMAGVNDPQLMDDLRALDDVDDAIALCLARHALPDGIDHETMRFRLDTVQHLYRLMPDYRAPASDLDVHFFSATPCEADAHEAWHGWQALVGRGSRSHMIGGTHETLLAAPRRQHIADLITDALIPAARYTPMISIQSGTPTAPALFCVPGAGATAFSLLELGMAFPDTLAVYAFQARGLEDPDQPPFMSVEGAADLYLKALRQRQPHGPYHLLGHSFGGKIAFELALRLEALGETVADLVLVDARPPQQAGDALPHADRLYTLDTLISLYNMRLRMPLSITRDTLEPLSESEQLSTLHAALIEGRILPSSSTSAQLAAVVQAMQANLNTGYCPEERYRGRLHLIEAEGREGTQSRAEGWRAFAETVEVTHAPGNHMTLLLSANVRQWVSTLLPRLTLSP